jgi:hypothetical protein
MTLRDTLTLSDTLSSSFIHLKFLFYLSKIIFKNFTQLDLEWGNILQLKIEKGGAKGKRETGHCLSVAPSIQGRRERELRKGGAKGKRETGHCLNVAPSIQGRRERELCKRGAKGKRETGHCLNVAPSTRLAGERALQRWICRQPWKSLALLSSLPVC